MGEQLNHTNNAEIVYLDFSSTSMSFAKQSAGLRGLNNIIFLVGWVEGIPRLGLGKFNLFHSSGVLHHLKSPLKGLNVLKSVLSTDGGGTIMVYGQYGRCGIYHLQSALRYINKKDNTLNIQIENAKSLLTVLPKSNWFQKIRHTITDHQTNSGIYDLLLHARDVSYSLPQLTAWLQGSGMKFINMATPSQRMAHSLNLAISDIEMYKQLQKSDIVKHKSIAEIIVGSKITHEVYISMNAGAEASTENLDNAFFLYGSPVQLRTVISSNRSHINLRDKTYVCAAFDASNSRDMGDSKPFAFPVNRFSNHILSYLTMQPPLHMTIGELILSFRRKHPTKSVEYLHRLFKELYLCLRDTGLFLLKKPNVGTFPKTCCYSHVSLMGAPNCQTYFGMG